MANLLLLADIASITCSNQTDVGVQTDDTSAIDDDQQKRNLISSAAPFGHDYIKQNDFDILVNANHDYYNRIPQTDEDLEHSYAFSVAQSLTDADCSAPINADNNVDDVFFEGIANLDEHMGIRASASGFADSSVFEEIVQEDFLSFSSTNDVVRLGGVELEATLFSDVVEIIEQNKLHFDDILRYVDVEPEHVDETSVVSASVVERPIIDVNFQPSVHVCCWNECLEKFPEMEKLTTHLRNEHVLSLDKTSPIVCKWRSCTKSTAFGKRYLLERHLRIHTFEKPFRCDVCRTNFASAEHLKRHVRKHLGKRPFLCKVCGKRFSSSGDYCRHIKTHEKNSDKYLCERCKKSYKDDSGLRKHKKKCSENEVQTKNPLENIKIILNSKKSSENVPLWLRDVIKKSSKIVVINVESV